MEMFMFVAVAVVTVIIVETTKHPLNEFIGHYEGLDYNTDIVHRSHQRARRSTSQSAEVQLNFQAHGRLFKLRLRRDTSTFFQNPEIVASDGSYHPLDVSHIYQGTVDGEPQSYVHGSIIDGIFSGRIDFAGETFYVDKAELYFPEMQPFHSVIYSDREVVGKPKRAKRSADESSCGLSDSSIYEWMKKVQNSAVEDHVPRKRDDGHYTNKYSHQANGGQRKKREASENRMCALFLQSDPMLWDYMTRSPTDKMGGLGYNSERAREEITSLFASHVDGIKKIYSNTTFKYQQYGPYAGFTFAVHRVQINTSAGCSSQSPHNLFCKPNIDVSNFLNLNSLSRHDLYCLAYVFTYRDFSQGTLGLAWVGSYLRASGGLCEKWKEYNENNRRIYKSLNTGIVTLVNYGSRVPPKVSTLTFAHEVGHNFGSPHDSGDVCVPSQLSPNNPYGNYVMFASATSGDKQNNHNFSVCSVGNMTLVLDAVLRQQNGKDNCFKESQEAFCGNRIVEGNEECDCGFESDCKNLEHPDSCCHHQESEKRCTRFSNATCSPSEGPCCLRTCSFVKLSDEQKCQTEKECSQAAYCNGKSAKCPLPNAKLDGSLCNSNTQICKKGECTSTVCEKIKWASCSINVPTDDKKFDREQLCYVSCLNPVTESCVSTGNHADIMKEENKILLRLLEDISLNKTGIRMPAGAPCDNFRGYCDVFQKCRAVNEDGPLARLKNLLFNQQTINNIRAWITEHWWAVLLMGLVLVVLMGLFIKVCAVHTPSSNPNQPQARKLTLPRRHTQRPQGPPPPYSASAPGPSWASGGPPQGKRQSRNRLSSSSQQPKSGRHSHGSRQSNFEMRQPRRSNNV